MEDGELYRMKSKSMPGRSRESSLESQCRSRCKCRLDFAEPSPRQAVGLAQPIETKWRIWLWGVDLNHRPLGYESKTIIIFNNLQDAGGP